MSTQFIESKAEEEQAPVLLILPGRQVDEPEARRLAESLSKAFRTFVAVNARVDPHEVTEYAKRLEGEMEQQGIKRATVVGIGPAGSIAEALGIRGAKSLRRLVLLDADSRYSPPRLQRIIDRAERFFPLGLPLRRLTKDFDARPMLHRIHCPSLVLVSPRADHFHAHQGEMLAQRIPNAWFKSLTTPAIDSTGSFSPEVKEVLEEFLQVPAKRPQKARKAQPNA